MKKKLFLMALTATALVSCSHDEVLKLQQDEIKFSIVTDNQSRAADVYCANNMITEFTVYGTYTEDGTTGWYMQGDNIKFQNSKWENTTATRYWSNTEDAHDFYAIVNGTMTCETTWNNTMPKVVDFVPEPTVASQKDLLYAVATDKDKDDAQVALNFRHALSQIEFKAKVTNPQMYVTISAVKVGQTNSKGTFTFPSKATTDPFVDHTQQGTNALNGIGTWELTNDVADYSVDVKVDNNEVAVAYDKDNATNLTISTDANGDTRDFSKSMLLLPTSSLATGTTAWTPEKNETAYDGTYLAVECKIYNVAGDSYVSGDVKLYEGWAVMPVSFTWEPGKKYIYTFVFGNGNGGYEPDPINPEPVLVPMSYTVTVDDFQKGTDSDVEMETK